MIIYDSTKKGFMEDVVNGNISDKIYDKFLLSFGKPSKSEYRSWENSLKFMYIALNYDDLPDSSGVAIEFNIPPANGDETDNSSNSENTSKKAILYDNIPNPFSMDTEIKFELLVDFSQAKLLITDLNGAEIKTFNITKKGTGSVIIRGYEIKAGIYNYFLIVDNTVVDNKKMVLLK